MRIVPDVGATRTNKYLPPEINYGRLTLIRNVRGTGRPPYLLGHGMDPSDANCIPIENAQL